MPIATKNGATSMWLDITVDAWKFEALGKIYPKLLSRKSLYQFLTRLPDSFAFDLTPEEEADFPFWQGSDLRREIEDRFIINGFSWKSMEQWMSCCYRMRINPLPALRNTLEAPLDSAVYYVDVLRCRDWPKSFQPGLTCIRDQRQPLKPSVTLVAHGTFEELAQAKADRERMLKIAGIR